MGPQWLDGLWKIPEDPIENFKMDDLMWGYPQTLEICEYSIYIYI